MDNTLNTTQSKTICDRIKSKGLQDVDDLKKLQFLMRKSPKNVCEYTLLSTIYEIHKKKQKLSSDAKLLLLETVKCVIDCYPLKSSKQLVYIQSVIMPLLEETDEDILLAAVDCLNELYSSMLPEFAQSFYSTASAFYFPKIIHNCLEIAQKQRLMSLKIKSIKCLSAIVRLEETDKAIRCSIADMCIKFVPGITIGMLKICAEDTRPKVIKKALRMLGNFIILMTEKDDNAVSEPTEIVYPIPEEPPIEPQAQVEKSPATVVAEIIDSMEKAKRTPEWFKSNDDKLKLVIESLNPLLFNSDISVRSTFVEMCHNIVAASNRIPLTMLACLEVCLTHSAHSEESSIDDLPSVDDIDDINTYIIDKFVEIVKSLREVMHFGEDASKLYKLNLCTGLLKYTEKQNINVFKTSMTLKLMMEVLVDICALEPRHFCVSEIARVTDFDTLIEDNNRWRYFVYLENKDIFVATKKLLHTIGDYHASHSLIELCISVVTHRTMSKNELIFMINEMMLGCRCENSVKVAIVGQIIDVYVDKANWYVPLSNEGTDVPTEIRRNMLQASLLAEGIGQMALACKPDFDSFLLKTLYIVLERAGSQVTGVCGPAIIALLNMATGCGFPSISVLLHTYMDYLSFQISNNIKRIDQNQEVVHVVNIIFNTVNKENMTDILDILESILDYCNCLSHAQKITLFLKSFHCFMKHIRRLTAVDQELRKMKVYMQTVAQLYSFYEVPSVDEDTNMTAQEMFDEDEKKREEENTKESDAVPVEVPREIKLTTAIIRVLTHFMCQEECQSEVLNVLREGVHVLAHSEDQLLPTVHLLWAQLVICLKSENLLVFINAMHLLCDLAELSKDFIRLRVSKDVLDTLCEKLNELAKESCGFNSNVYMQRRAATAQQLLLRSLPTILKELEMSRQDVRKALEAAGMCLDMRQPPRVQEWGYDMYMQTSKYDLDTVWDVLLQVRKRDYKSNVSQRLLRRLVNLKL